MANICSIDGCGGAHEAKGWCAKHYRRWKTHGDPTIILGGEKAPRGAPMKFITDHIGFEDKDCLVWPFNRDRATGVPQISVNRTTVSPARIMCEKVHGAPPTPEHHAAHWCGNSHLGCVHPKHIRWATPSENEMDKRAHGRAPIGAAHGMAKINDAIALEIIHSKESLSKVAARFGISTGTAGKIRRREKWKHLG